MTTTGRLERTLRIKHKSRDNSEMARATKMKQASNGAILRSEAKLFLAADKLRGNMDGSEYKRLSPV